MKWVSVNCRDTDYLTRRTAWANVVIEDIEGTKQHGEDIVRVRCKGRASSLCLFPDPHGVYRACNWPSPNSSGEVRRNKERKKEKVAQLYMEKVWREKYGAKPSKVRNTTSSLSTLRKLRFS